MKLRSNLAARRPSRRLRLAFTLPELMIAMTIFLMVVIGTIYGHLLGLKLFNVTAAKLGASHNARAALNRVREDVRSGKKLYVGNGTGTAFSSIGLGVPQKGNALKIQPTDNTNFFVYYFLTPDPRPENPGAQQLRRTTSASGSDEIIARYITNKIAFYAKDYKDNILTNSQNNVLVEMDLEFYQWEFPVAQIGALYDYYRLQTRIARRAID